ncbi:uncharacterized protein N7498_009740 [Penicillium cinerascens]|uniref:Uncharacterized protein n=1 Tax=Penicillium cinerascens TaxID=70096 RepID=A0A9W9J9I3_9EURO|nr:uncharacterized protein N7498_009740 [Penicillium cinerascens]KAJ5190755.1 hypothetical protein N7498_009740 [Penicillium cinerascens]
MFLLRDLLSSSIQDDQNTIAAVTNRPRLTDREFRTLSTLRMVSPWPILAHIRSSKITPSKDEAALGSDGRLTKRSGHDGDAFFAAGLENLAH